MSPAALPGFMAVIVVVIGIWTLLGGAFVLGLAAAAAVAVAVKLAIRERQERHPVDHSLLHLDSDPTSKNYKDRRAI